MTRYVVASILTVASLGTCTPGYARQAVSARPSLVAHAEAAKVVAAFHAALGRGDVASVTALLADEALIYESGGVERGKAEYASHHLPADAAFARALRRSITRTAGQAHGDMAWIASEARSTGTYKGRAIDNVDTETMILRRAGSTWRIVHIHWSAAAPKKITDAAK